MHRRFLFYFERVQKEDIDDKHEELKQLNENAYDVDKVIAEIYSKRTGKKRGRDGEAYERRALVDCTRGAGMRLVDEIDNYEDTTTPETGMTAMARPCANAHGCRRHRSIL